MAEFLGLTGTIGRRSFILWIIASFVLTIVIGLVAAGAAIAADQPHFFGAASFSVMLPGLALFAYMQTVLAGKRIRDTARSAWLVLPFAAALIASSTFTMLGEDGWTGLCSLLYWILLVVIAAMPSRSNVSTFVSGPRQTRNRQDLVPAESPGEPAMTTLVRERVRNRTAFGRR